jgi:sulfofructose kinase
VDDLPLDTVGQAPAVLVDLRWPDAGQALLERARAEGVPSVLDADLAPVSVLWRLMPRADHVWLSEVALERLFPGETPAGALAVLARELPRAAVVGVTLGAEGALLAEPNRGDPALRAIAGFRVEPVDTLNAGDVWHGAYVAGLVGGLDLDARVRLAHAAAALKCTRPWGRLGAPHRAEVHAFLAEHGVALA